MAVVRDRGYGGSLPGPEDVLLLAEVAHASLAYDRNVKLPLYARAGIREVWIVDLSKGVVERYSARPEDGYRSVERARSGEEVESTALTGLGIRVDDVLG